MAIYLKKFETTSQYDAYIASENKVLPNVSLTEDANTVHYNPKHDYSKDYFTMVVTTGGNIKWNGSTTANTLSYSKDNGSTWATANSGTTISVVDGDKVLWKGTPTPQTSFPRSVGIGKFSDDTTARYSVEGNAMSLLYGDDFKNKTSLEGKDYALFGLFSYNTNVTSAEKLSLPATTLATQCYSFMFNGCTSLTTAPELPATTLAQSCYQRMFFECTNLTTAQSVLPATTLAEGCYCYMFYNCTSLTTAPQLPATTLAGNCYSYMFYDCTNLTTAPSVLPATTLVDYCYSNMFGGCTSLTTAPELPATTLAEYCYEEMFYNCTSLTTAPSVLPATTLAERCYDSMFEGCTSLTTAPELPATTLTNYCYYGMFYGCTSLNSIKCLATNISATNCTTNWVRNVSASGTFTKATSMTSWKGGEDGIPFGWTVQYA